LPCILRLLSIFCLVLNHPPPTTRSPLSYTTLFRSRRGDPRPDDRHTDDQRDQRQPDRAAGGSRGGPQRGKPLGPAAPAPGFAGPDRKSTRLNSSHQIISYAVFCLKKKTTHPRHVGL